MRRLAFQYILLTDWFLLWQPYSDLSRHLKLWYRQWSSPDDKAGDHQSIPHGIMFSMTQTRPDIAFVDKTAFFICQIQQKHSYIWYPISNCPISRAGLPAATFENRSMDSNRLLVCGQRSFFKSRCNTTATGNCWVIHASTSARQLLDRSILWRMSTISQP